MGSTFPRAGSAEDQGAAKWTLSAHYGKLQPRAGRLGVMHEFEIHRPVAGCLVLAAVAAAGCGASQLAAPRRPTASAVSPSAAAASSPYSLAATPAPVPSPPAAPVGQAPSSEALGAIGAAATPAAATPAATAIPSYALPSEPVQGEDVLVMPWHPVPAPPDFLQGPSELISPWQPPPSTRNPIRPVPVSITPRDPIGARWRGGTIIAPTAKGATQCLLAAQSPNGRAVGYCVRVAQGPLIVTDIHASGSCSADLFALSGSVGDPVWIAYIPKGTATHITGASLHVPAGVDLIIGASAPTEARIGRDLSCSVTWAGWASSALPLDAWLEDRF